MCGFWFCSVPQNSHRCEVLCFVYNEMSLIQYIVFIVIMLFKFTIYALPYNSLLFVCLHFSDVLVNPCHNTECSFYWLNCSKKVMFINFSTPCYLHNHFVLHWHLLCPRFSHICNFVLFNDLIRVLTPKGEFVLVYYSLFVVCHCSSSSCELE